MPVSRSAGVIVFKNTPESRPASEAGRRYLVIRSSREDTAQTESHSNGRFRIAEAQRAKARYSHAEFWDIPKEELEKGEQGIDAALRAVREEAGIEEIKLIPDFKQTVQYFTRGRTLKFVAVFLGETKQEDVKLSWEHDKYEWLAYEEAYKRISVPQMKKALEAAENFLNKL